MQEMISKQPFEPMSWYKEQFVRDEDANRSLSDIFQSIFSHIGKQVILFDPYFMGLVQYNQHDDIQLKDCQIAFINAMMGHLFKNEWKAKFIIIGSRNRSNLNMKKTYDEYYHILNKTISRNGNLMDDICPQNIDFRYISTPFHGRYYFALDENDCLISPIIVTNSIGNICEIDIVEVNTNKQKQLISNRYNYLYKNSIRMGDVQDESI